MHIYHDQLMDHYHHPRHAGVVTAPTFATRQYNPSCGDLISLTGTIVDGRLTHIAFQGKGCVISQAAASMLCEYAHNKSVQELATAVDADLMLSLVGIPLGPTRMRCALLVMQALKDALEN